MEVEGSFWASTGHVAIFSVKSSNLNFGSTENFWVFGIFGIDQKSPFGLNFLLSMKTYHRTLILWNWIKFQMQPEMLFLGFFGSSEFNYLFDRLCCRIQTNFKTLSQSPPQITLDNRWFHNLHLVIITLITDFIALKTVGNRNWLKCLRYLRCRRINWQF